MRDDHCNAVNDLGLCVGLPYSLDYLEAQMTRDTVWQDDPPFAVGEAQMEPAMDDLIRWEQDASHGIAQPQDSRILYLIARIKAVREQTIRDLRNNYKCGEEYEAGLWSRRNIEAFFRDQEKE